MDWKIKLSQTLKLQNIQGSPKSKSPGENDSGGLIQVQKIENRLYKYWILVWLSVSDGVLTVARL